MRCLVEDTIHCNDLNKAPLINAALGISIRSAGLTRPKGGAKGFWNAFHQRHRTLFLFFSYFTKDMKKLAGNCI